MVQNKKTKYKSKRKKIKKNESIILFFLLVTHN